MENKEHAKSCASFLPKYSGDRRNGPDGEARRDCNCDGYHSFDDLYEYRKLYNAALFNEWAATGRFNVHISRKHHDGEDCFGGGWFIVMATLPTGQISNHYEMKDWSLFHLCNIKPTADEWDGHTPQDVAKRLRDFLTPSHH